MDWQITIDTKKDTLEVIEPFKIDPHTNDEREAKLCTRVSMRLTQMRAKRSAVDKYWDLYQRMWEAIYVPYEDGRSRSQVPLEMAIVELYVAEALKRKTQFKIEEENSDYEKQAEAFEKVWDYDWSTNNRDAVILENEYVTAVFGTSVLYTGFEMKYRVIKEPTIDDETGDVVFTRKLQNTNKILVENVDIRNFFIDDKAKSIEDAVDCIFIEYVPEEEFRNYQFNKAYKNTDAIKWSYIYNADTRSFVTREEKGESAANYVKIIHYWDCQADMYLEIANDAVIIREHPILNSSKSLPFVIRQYSKNPFAVYGRGLCEILMTFKSDLNSLREMLMDAIKRSNNQVIAIGWGLEFDWNQFSFGNQMLKFKGNLGNGNFNQLSGNPPNQAIFTYMDSIFTDIAIFSGIDIRNIMGNPQQTAYQTAVQKESSLQRVNVVLTNRDSAFVRLANLHKDNIQLFFPIKLVRELIKVDDANNPVDPKWVEAKYPSIPLKGEKYAKGKFSKSDKSGQFEVKPDFIRGKICMNVFTNLNAPTINEVEKEQKLDFFTRLATVGNAYATIPNLDQIIPEKETIKELARLFDIDTHTSSEDPQKVAEAKQQLIADIQAQAQWGGGMPQASGAPAGWMPAPQWASAPQAPTKEQQAPMQTTSITQ